MNVTLEKPTRKTPVVITDYLKTKIITKSAEGMPQRHIAKQVNITQPAISNLLNKPEVKALTQRLKEALQEKYIHKFVARTVKEAKAASKLSDYALGITKTNDTLYKDVDQIEKYLTRMDRTGTTIAKGVGVLDTNTMYIGDDNSQHVTISAPYQEFLDYQAKKQATYHDEVVKDAVISGDSGEIINE